MSTSFHIEITASGCLCLINFAVDIICLKKILRCVKSGYGSLMHYDDPVSTVNGGNSLGDNKLRRSGNKFFHRLADLRIRRRIDRRCGVIENQDLRLLDQGSGDTKSLALSAGDVRAALLEPCSIHVL